MRQDGHPQLLSSLNLFLIRIFALLVPRLVHAPFALLTACLFYLLLGEQRRGVRENLRVVTGRGIVELLLLSTFYKFARNWIDIALTMAEAGRVSSLVAETIGGDQLENALKSGKGAILVSPHLGNWELGGLFLGGKGYHLNVLTYREGDEGVNSSRERARAGHGINLIYVDRNDTSPLAAVEAVNALRRNEVVVLLGDRDGSSHSRVVDFFGRPAPLPAGAVYLSLATGAPIIPVFVIYKKGRYAAIMEDAIAIPDQRGNRDEVINEVTKRLVAVFEKYIRRYPDQWYNFFRYWKMQERTKDV